MKKYLFMILLIGVCFGSIILESDDQIQNSIYYDSADEGSYHRISDGNTSFKIAKYSPSPPKLIINPNYQWQSDYIILIKNLNKELKHLLMTNNNHIENYLIEENK